MKKEVHENVGIWACFLTEVFLKGVPLLTHMAVLKKACVKSVHLIKPEVVFLDLKKKLLREVN